MLFDEVLMKFMRQCIFLQINRLIMNQKKWWTGLEIAVIVLFAMVPLFFSLPYRVNIFLSWEGAYRISNGELPFRDFGVPLGGMYWVIPAVFFKMFGAQMFTLIKAQVFINILSGLAFRSILKSLSVQPALRLASVLLYCVSFSFLNFWPWYNHTVIVYGFIALAFIVKLTLSENRKYALVWALLAGLFTFFSFFTKQDGGGLIFVICFILLAYHSWLSKKWIDIIAYTGGTVAFTAIAVLIFSRYEFSYWFNHGQPPHNARISVSDIANEFFGGSQWLKFYFVVVILLALATLKDWKTFIKDKRGVVFLLLTLGILCFAAIFQVTSYTPDNSNIFFHSFAFVFIFSYVLQYFSFNLNTVKIAAVLCIGVFFWWSHLYWNYMQRILNISNGESKVIQSATGENVVNKHNSIIHTDTFSIGQGNWVSINLPTLRKITMPEPTVKGVERILNMDIVKNNKDLKVLNMSELTFLAAEIPYKMERGARHPLWYHLGVGMFNRELAMFESRIRENYYDIIIFEYIDDLNNFYPFSVHDLLKTQYKQVDEFFAPRNTNPGMIEVYIRK